MAALDISYYVRCIDTLDKAYQLLQEAEKESINYDMYRSACIKEFEVILEQSGKLLKRILKPFFHTSKAVDKLYFKEVFRFGVKHDLLSPEASERWMEYRDNRNRTAHDYGVDFAEETLALLPLFISDARELARVIQKHSDATQK